MSIKINELDDVLNRIIYKLENSKKDYTLLATEFAEGIFKARVFGYGAKDINGAALPVYSKKYAADKGKRASTWDLQDSLALRESIQIDTKQKGKRTVLMFNDDKQIKKADGLEKRSGQTIFEISPKERQQILDDIKREMLTDIRKIINESFK